MCNICLNLLEIVIPGYINSTFIVYGWKYFIVFPYCTFFIHSSWTGRWAGSITWQLSSAEGRLESQVSLWYAVMWNDMTWSLTGTQTGVMGLRDVLHLFLDYFFEEPLYWFLWWLCHIIFLPLVFKATFSLHFLLLFFETGFITHPSCPGIDYIN